MVVAFKSVAMRSDIVAPVIYGSCPHQTTDRLAGITPEACDELGRFLNEFTQYHRKGMMRKSRIYYRVDAYFDSDRLWILEVNTAFVDGWGTALNLSRAAGLTVPKKRLRFPRRFATIQPVYLPELELFAAELAELGIDRPTICEWQGEPQEEELYVYGRINKTETNILPYAGVFRDRKDHLMSFAYANWQGHHIHVPRHFWCDMCSWDDVPANAVLKFVEKDGPESLHARQSVIMGKPQGKAKFLRRCFAEGRLIAQERIRPGDDCAQLGNGNCQLIILAIDGDPITGYTQFSHEDIINDDSVHGPLELWCDPETYR